MRLLAVKNLAILFTATLTLIGTILPADPVVGVGQEPQVDLERALEIVGSMEDAWETINDYTAIVAKTERFRDGTVRSEQALVKYRKPADHYLRVLDGDDKGAEVLYPTGDNNDLILAHKGGVTGAVARFIGGIPGIGRVIPKEFGIEDPRLLARQHHIIFDINLGKVGRLIAQPVRTSAEHGEGKIIFHPSEEVNGRPADVMELLYPADAGIIRTVQEGDTLFSVAPEWGQDMAVILYNNPEIDGPTDLRAGQSIFVPRYYGARVVLWIGQEPRLPLKLEIYDGEGRLYESYEHSELRLNTGLTDMDFDPANPEYRFR
jgi:outer membrane lipoprotein-sorting protein